jgi:PII-like signaling protein
VSADFAMLPKGAAKKVTIYVNEDTRHHLGPLYEAILTFLMHKGVAGATASRSLAGFGAHRVMHTNKVEVLAEHLPVRIEFIETAEKVDELLPTLYDMVADGLIEVQDTTVIKAASVQAEPQIQQSHEIRRGKARLMRIFLGEADQWHGEPLYQAIVKRLRMMDIAGATVYRGILGYGVKGHTHKQNFLHLSRDLPVMIAVVDSEEKLAHASQAVEEMIEDGLIVFSDVDIVRLVHTHSIAEATEARS